MISDGSERKEKVSVMLNIISLLAEEKMKNSV